MRRRFQVSIFHKRSVTRRRDAFTLLEILIVLVLMAVLLVGLSSIVRLFSRHYTANERRVGRAQLARSISQMLSDDLGAAIQDPIVAVDNDPTRQFVRHFGLRGDSRSLQIDVVQPNAFAPIADSEENRRVMTGGDKNSNTRQVPELKTIFYEFVPINETQKLPGESDEETTTTAASENDGADLGSTLGGSLSSVAGEQIPGFETAELESSELYWDGIRPLAQKFGLSRRELDYETPEENDGESDETANNASLYAAQEGETVSQLSGSLSAPPDAALSTLAGGAAAPSAALSDLIGAQTESFEFKPPMTAAQIAMDSDDGTTWAPEVLDCRFRYFDGANWLDAWDSLEMNGLPVAIKVELKLAPLDDVDYYRASPLLLSLPFAPSVAQLTKLAAQAKSEARDGGADVSRLAGTLSGAPGASNSNEPIDVFNSYRPPTSVLAALQGTPLSTKNVAPFSQTTQSSALADQTERPVDGSDELATENEVDAASLDLGLNGSLAGGLTETPDSGASDGSGEGFLQQAQELAASGAVYDESGVCVDFSNDGTYVTLEQIAKEIGVSEPGYYEVVAYLPTTPFSRAKTIERRQPTRARSGMVATNAGRGANNAGGRRNPSANPYATGTTRAPRNRQANERSVAERRPRENQANERAAANRTAAQRGAPSERAVGERRTNARAQRERGGTERVAANRAARERFGINGGTGTGGLVSDSEGLPIGAEVTGLVSDETGPIRGAGTELDPNAPIIGDASGVANSVGGALGGADPNGAINLGAFDPFSIVEQTASDVPFSDSAFADVDAANANFAPGLVADPTGADATQTPNPSVRAQPSGQKQTWIRGNKK